MISAKNMGLVLPWLNMFRKLPIMVLNSLCVQNYATKIKVMLKT